MNYTDIQKEITQDRRAFIKKVLGGTIAGSLLLVIPATAEQLVGRIPGMRDEAGGSSHKKFAFIVDIAACIGCGSCCVADKAEYRVSDGHYRTWVERYVVDDRGNVSIDSPNGGLDGYSRPRETLPHPAGDIFYVPKLCNNCEKPSCVQVCPVGATYKTPDGFILIDGPSCIGCSECIRACPYSVRFINPRTGAAEKCTWCYQRVREGMVPACVAACPVKARKFGDLADPNSEVRKILHESHVVSVLRPDMNMKPALHYVGLPKEVV